MSSMKKSTGSVKKSTSAAKSTRPINVGVVTPTDLIIGGLLAGGITTLICKHHENKIKRYLDCQFNDTKATIDRDYYKEVKINICR